MERKSVQRFAALAIVISLALAGAQPAAAGSLSLLDRLGSFWSFLNREPGTAPAARRAVSPGATRARQAKVAQPTPAASDPDKGWGLDPNGNTFFLPAGPTGLP